VASFESGRPRIRVGRSAPEGPATESLLTPAKRHAGEVTGSFSDGVPRSSGSIRCSPKFGDGRRTDLRYDFLIDATGPSLRFDKTPGLGPEDGHSLSVCLPDHAAQTAAALDEEVERMRRGERRKFLVGVGHGTCTCEGAAFEYIVNLKFELRNRGVRDKAEITWITNEYELGDFGMGGMHLKRAGYITPSSVFNASLFAERGIDWITRAHIRRVPEALGDQVRKGEWERRLLSHGAMS
jgi:hypothetical protein